jgi:hypothetical protein
LTSARHDVFNKNLAEKYPESFDPKVPKELIYSGSLNIDEKIKGIELDAGKLVLSPTRTYAPIIKKILDQFDSKTIHGMIHCSGGAQTKILHFIDNLHVVKDNLFDIPPLFQTIKKESDTSWEEMYKVFNMGHRMELYVSPESANQIIKISTLGKIVHKNEFENHLLEWILYNYSEQVTLNMANFELQFYNQNQFTKTISDIKIANIQTSNLFFSKREKVKNLFEKINKYNFEVKTFEKEYDPNDFSTLSNFKSSFEYTNEPVIINNYEINDIKKSLKKILNIVPEKEFFNFGELKETKTMGLGFPLVPDKTILIGSEIEKEKKNLYQDFYWEINELTDLLDFWKKISKSSILPIVITNTGKQHNEEIKVQLSITENVKIIKSKSFPMPKMFQNLKDLNSDYSFLFRNIKHNQNSIVNEYYSGYIMPQFINFGMFGYEQKDQEEDKFRSILNYYFDYNYYYDKPKQTIIECDFKELNTNEILAFPTYIFVKSKTDFTIEYEITCKNEPEKITGKLEYKAYS